MVLSWHVNYWDRLGWKDKYASAAYTRRQQAYADGGKTNGLATPQFLVANTFVEGAAFARQLDADARRAPTFGIDAAAKLADGKVSATVKLRKLDTGELNPALRVVVVLYQKSSETECKAGENSGRKLKEYFLVLNARPPEPARNCIDKELPVKFDAPPGADAANLGLAVLVEDSATLATVECKAVPVEPSK